VRLLITFFLLFISNIICTQNLSRLGSNIKDDNSDNVILKGINLGGWMLQEPYLFHFTGAANSQHEFKEKLVDFIGQQNTDDFYNAWYENFVTEGDIESLASLGFNSVRLPMHYNLFTLPIQNEPIAGQNTWLDLGFSLVDNLLDWCEANNMYLILDLHAAPGGQGSNSDINDYNPNQPSLWESTENKNKTIALWGKLAERYKNEPWIGGYDLLNETHWSLQENELRNLYIQITNEIRQHDQNHIIFVEGNDFANNFAGLTPPWDSNMVYSFHKYWSYNNSLDWVISIRDTYDVPLWMGEAGENSNQWFTEAIKVFEDNNIGWAFWPWKKLESISAPFSISSNSDYESLVNYFRGNSGPPTVENAINGLMKLAEDSHISNNVFQKDVVDAMIRQPNTTQTLPFSELNNIPGILYASDYDLGPMGYAYADADYATYHVSTQEFEAWNQGWQYRNDGVDIEFSSDENGNGYHIGFVQDGEWLLHTVNIENSGFYDLVTRYAADSNGKIKIEVNGYPISDEIMLYDSGSWNDFYSKLTQGVYLNEGVAKLKTNILSDGFNLSSIEFSETQTIPNFSIENAYTNDNSEIYLLLNHPINDQEILNSYFDLFINGSLSEIISVNVSQVNNQILILESSEVMTFLDNIHVSYNYDDKIYSFTGEFLPAYNLFPVDNYLDERLLLPGLIQAEDYINQDGFEIENCTDFGNGFNLSYSDNNDFAEYPVLITESGLFDINLRIAGYSGEILIQLRNGSSVQNIAQVSLINTGGWQNWETITETSTYINSGLYNLRIITLESGFNLNWMDFSYVEGSMSLSDTKLPYFKLYPNPASEKININTSFIDFNIEIFDLIGNKIFETKNIKNIDLKDFNIGIYLLKISSGQYTESKLFIKK